MIAKRSSYDLCTHHGSRASGSAASLRSWRNGLPPGRADLAFRRSRNRTVLATALAASPLRLLLPRNHGDAIWVFLANLGGGLVDGDCLEVRADVAEGASALLSTQSSTKVYRSPRGCSQRLEARVGDDAALTIIPDPIACFHGARYAQEIEVTLAPRASLLLLDGYTCGRSARGERWAFAHYASRTRIARGDKTEFVDAVRLDPAHGSIAERMGRFDVVLSLLAMGPRFAPVRDAILAPTPAPTRGDCAVVAASSIRGDGALVRIAAERFERASCLLRPSFAALSRVLGDDPFRRKW
jgi:urease accessory protein